MHRAVITQLLKQGAAIMRRKQWDSTSYSGAFVIRLCLGLFAMSRSCFCRRLAAGRGSEQERQLVEGEQRWAPV